MIEEAIFLEHRLEVVSAWPDSDYRTAVIRASTERLQDLGFTIVFAREDSGAALVRK